MPGLTLEVERALRALPARERACVVLRHLEDVSVRERGRAGGEHRRRRSVGRGVDAHGVDLATGAVRTLLPLPADDTGSGGSTWWLTGPASWTLGRASVRAWSCGTSRTSR